jgi:hypothetical protein
MKTYAIVSVSETKLLGTILATGPVAAIQEWRRINRTTRNDLRAVFAGSYLQLLQSKGGN